MQHRWRLVGVMRHRASHWALESRKSAAAMLTVIPIRQEPSALHDPEMRAKLAAAAPLTLAVLVGVFGTAVTASEEWSP
jgi:hypothetical protein